MALILVSVVQANAAINFTYTSVTASNYTITDEVLNSENFVRLVDSNRTNLSVATTVTAVPEVERPRMPLYAIFITFVIIAVVVYFFVIRKG